MGRKIYDINRTDNIITIQFFENGKRGIYTQDLDKDGVDIKRVMRPITEQTEESLKNKVSFYVEAAPQDVQFMSDESVIRTLESVLR